jgi:hypothetical protein
VRAIWASPEERHVSVSSLCSTCSATGHSARECPSKTVGICNSCGDKTHQQHDALLTRLCVHCQEHGHDEAKCFRPKYRACCRSTLRNARSFECREHTCTHKCKGAMDPTGHNKTNCRKKMDRICSICEPCGSSKCQSATNFQCPEHTRTKLMQRLALSPKGRKLHITRRKLSTVPVWAAPNRSPPGAPRFCPPKPVSKPNYGRRYAP